MSIVETHDVVIVGGGHNGLVAAAYLARAGRRVVVLERRPFAGGATVSEEFAPGFRGATGASLCGLLRPEIARDLELERRGLQLLAWDPWVVALGDGGPALRLWRDEGRTQQEIAAVSPGDARSYAAVRALFLEVARAIDPLLLQEPPRLDRTDIMEALVLVRQALRLRRRGKRLVHEALRMAPMSLRDFLTESFETELLRASLAVDGLLGTFRGPWSPFTAFGLVHHFLAELRPPGWALVRGGMGSLAAALASAAQEAGASIRTSAEVARIVSEEGRVTGVELASGEAIPARVVMSSADPKRTFLGLANARDLGPDFVLRVRNFEAEGCVARLNLALDSAPAIPALGDSPPVHFRIAPSLEYIERAWDDARHGLPSKAPFLDVVVPSAVDPSVAPPGKHVMTVLAQYAPFRLRRGGWDAGRERFTETVLGILEEHVPNLRRSLLATETLVPPDLESRLGLTGGHIYHGEMTINQQAFLRPVPGWSRYRTPIHGLYLCGSGAHPGGGVTGAPGYNAARAVLEDWPSLAGPA